MDYKRHTILSRFFKIGARLTDLTCERIGIDKWTDECREALNELKERLCSSPVMTSPDSSKPFPCHTDASAFAVWGNLFQLDANANDRAISYFSELLCLVEESYTTIDRERLGLVCFLKGFRCYLECSSFQGITENLKLKDFIKKPGRREARWFQFLPQFGISKMTLEKGKIHLLGGTLSRAPHAPLVLHAFNHLSIDNAELLSITGPDRLYAGYSADSTFPPI